MAFVTAAIGLAQAGVSVYQALEAKSRMEEAEVAAKKASANALRQTEINPYEELSVPTAEYMQQREAAQRMVSAGVQRFCLDCHVFCRRSAESQYFSYLSEMFH